EQILPGTRVLHINRSLCWAVLGDARAKKADLERALTIAPTSAVDHFWHGFAHHLQGDLARSKGDHGTARDHYRKESAEYSAYLPLSTESFWGYFNGANSHAQIGVPEDLHDAIVGYTACMRLRPDFAWPYNNRGTAHLRLGEYDLAVADYTAAVARN